MVDQKNLADLMEMYLTECELRKLAPRTIEGYRKIPRPMLLWLDDNEQVDRMKVYLVLHGITKRKCTGGG